jgi:hypothetical protein
MSTPNRVHPMPTRCPVTGELLHVTRLQAPTSGVVIEGHFAPNEFALLPADHLEILRLFVKARGNLKELERVLGLSYPTVRGRFDALLRALGYESSEPPAAAPERAEILSRLERGEIDATEATRALQALRR